MANNIYTDENLNLLKGKSAAAMPDNPSTRGWSASQIKKTLYEPALMLFEWARENGSISDTRYNELKTQVDTNTIDIETLQEQVKEILSHGSFDIIEVPEFTFFPSGEGQGKITQDFYDKVKNSKFPILKNGYAYYVLEYKANGEYEFARVSMGYVYSDDAQHRYISSGQIIVKEDLSILLRTYIAPHDLYYNNGKLYLFAVDGNKGKGIDVKKINGEDLVGQAGNIELVKASEKGQPNGVATLGSDGKVLSSQLPDGIDEIIEGTLNSKTKFTDTKGKVWQAGVKGVETKIFIDVNTNKSYRWSGSQFGAIADDLALGYTHETAFYGDEGLKNTNDIKDINNKLTGNDLVKTTTQSLTKEQQQIAKENLNVLEGGITTTYDGKGKVTIENGSKPIDGNYPLLRFATLKFEVKNGAYYFDSESLELLKRARLIFAEVKPTQLVYTSSVVILHPVLTYPSDGTKEYYHLASSTSNFQPATLLLYRHPTYWSMQADAPGMGGCDLLKVEVIL